MTPLTLSMHAGGDHASVRAIVGVVGAGAHKMGLSRNVALWGELQTWLGQGTFAVHLCTDIVKELDKCGGTHPVSSFLCLTADVLKGECDTTASRLIAEYLGAPGYGSRGRPPACVK
jgi:hypothetical protein